MTTAYLNGCPANLVASLAISGPRPRKAARWTDALQRVEDALASLEDPEGLERVRSVRVGLGTPELCVALFGEFSRGKSTLVNALLGRVILPAKLVPTTGQVTRIVGGSADEIRVRFAGGRREVCPLERLDSFTSLDGEGRARADLVEVEVVTTAPLLGGRRLVLLDTPGVNDPGRQSASTRQALERADLVLFLLDAQQLLNVSERELAVDWLTGQLDKPVVPVVNFWNRVEGNDREAVRRRLETWTRAHLRPVLGRPWFAVNALGALRHALGRGEDPGDDTAALRTALEEMSEDQRQTLQGDARRGVLHVVLRQIGQGNAPRLEQLRQERARREADHERRRREMEVRVGRLRADAAGRREVLLARARAELSTKLQHLIDIWFRGESKASLESNASRWYENSLTAAVEAIQKEANTALVAVAAAAGLPPAAPLDLAAGLDRNVTLSVGTLAPTAASDRVTGIGKIVGGILGSFLLLGAGTAAGALAGHVIASKWGEKPPDYVPHYAAQARLAWDRHQKQVDERLAVLWDERIAELAGRLQQESDAPAATTDDPAVVEMSRRQALAEALARCEQELREVENLARWQASGRPRAWVEARRGNWDHAAWLGLLDDLRRSPFWPMQPDSVGAVLEEYKSEWFQRRQA